MSKKSKCHQERRNSPSVASLRPTSACFLTIFSISRSSTRSEEHTSELQSHRDLHSFPTRRSSDLEIEMPPGAAEFAIGRELETDIGLFLDDLLDLAVFH